MIELAKLLDPELMIAAEKTRVSKAYETLLGEEEFRKNRVAIQQGILKAMFDRENRRLSNETKTTQYPTSPESR